MAVVRDAPIRLNNVYRGIEEPVLRENCTKARISQNATDRLVQHYCYNRTAREIADSEFVEVDTIKVSIKRSRRKLNK